MKLFLKTILWVAFLLIALTYFKQDTFIEKVKFTTQLFEFELQAKEKKCSTPNQ